MDIDLCQRIQCGALSQAEAGFDLLLECSQAGMAGAKGCGHPDCAPYVDEMRDRGVCPPAYTGREAASVPALVAPSPVPILAATLPSIVLRRPIPAPLEPYEEPWYCPINRWAGQNKLYAVLVLAGVYWVLGGGRSAR